MSRLSFTLCALLLTASVALPVHAQNQPVDSHDDEARALFSAGQTAFNDARYPDALQHFRRAYELSHRAELLYNIGITEDRLRHDAPALAVFEQFLAEVPEHAKRREVEARVDVLRQAVSGQAAAAGATSTAATTEAEPSPAAAPEAATASNAGGPSLIGPIALGTVGLAGLIVAVVGATASNDCLTKDNGVCVEERTTAWGPTALYGGVGLAAIAGVVVWLVMGMPTEAHAHATVGVDGARLQVRF
jgi:hypothetical protein